MVEIALLAWEPIYAGFRRDMGEALYLAVHPDWRQEKGDQIGRNLGKTDGNVGDETTDRCWRCPRMARCHKRDAIRPV